MKRIFNSLMHFVILIFSAYTLAMQVNVLPNDCTVASIFTDNKSELITSIVCIYAIVTSVILCSKNFKCTKCKH